MLRTNWMDRGGGGGRIIGVIRRMRRFSSTKEESSHEHWKIRRSLIISSKIACEKEGTLTDDAKRQKKELLLQGINRPNWPWKPRGKADKQCPTSSKQRSNAENRSSAATYLDRRTPAVISSDCERVEGRASA